MVNRVMKDSGIEWIGKIPNDWNVISSKYLYSIQKGKIPKTVDQKADEQYVPYISMEYQRRDILPKEYAHINDGVYANKSDIAVLWDGANAGEIFKSKMGVISSTVALLKGNSNINKEYLFFVLKAFEKNLRALTVGMGIPHVNSEIIKNIKMPFPTQKEQQKIASFLDEKVSHINNIIEDTKKSIENLKVYKQSLITETVTKGLNPNVEMKDSGIDWVGKIPKHWMLRKIKHLTSKIGSGKTPRGGGNIYSNEGILFLRSQNIYETGLYLENATYISPKIDDSMKSTRVYSNDVLLNITGGSIGRACVYPQYIETHANVNQHVCILRPIQEYTHPSYLFYYLISHVGRNYIRYYQTGGNREGLNFEQIGNFAIPSFSIHEQTKIVNYLDEKTSQVDQIVNQQEQLVKEFESYKRSIIYEYVTGKKEVK